MPPVLWVLQSICPTLDARALKGACAALGIETRVTDRRAEGELPDVPTDRPVLFYGSCRFIRNVVQSGRWHPGAYYDDHTFRFSTSLRHWGARMLNGAVDLLPLGSFDAGRYAAQREIFVRPDRGLKELSGCVWPVGDFAKYVEKLRASGGPALEIPIVIGPKQRIDTEWRLFIVDGRVSTGCRYERYGDPDYSTEIPPDLITFAEDAAAVWSPARAFVLDIATVDENLFILEFNGINSAGFYRADVGRLVSDLIRGLNI